MVQLDAQTNQTEISIKIMVDSKINSQITTGR